MPMAPDEMHNARRAAVVVVVAALAAALGVGVAAVSSHHGHEASGTTAPRRTERVVPEILHFKSVATGSAYVDNAGKGFSGGDMLTEHTVWSSGGKTVGSMALTATVTQRTGKDTGEVMFTAVADIDGGQLVMSGDYVLVPQNQTFRAAVVGGTGAFSEARGYAVFKQVSANATLVTVSVTK